MVNCLVKNLKASVQDDNLEKFGVLKMRIKTSSGNTNTVIRVSGKTTIYTDGTKNLYQYGSSTGSAITSASALIVQFRDSGPYDVYIKPKYNISGACEFKMNGTIDISGLRYTNITSIDILDVTKFVGDIAALSGKNMVSIKLPNCDELYGSFDNVFGPMTTLTDFNIGGTEISGDVVEFVKQQVKAGRTSYTFEAGHISYLGAATGIKFNGQTIRNRDVNVLSWQDNQSDNTKIDITLQTGTQQQGDAPMTATVSKLT